MRCKTSLVRKALSFIEDRSFMFSFYATDGSVTGCGGDNIDDSVRFTKGEILYLLSKEVSVPKYFRGLGLRHFSLNKRIDDIALEYAGDYASEEDLDYGGYSEEFDSYVELWKEAIGAIEEGLISEARIQNLADAFNDFEMDLAFEVCDFYDESE